MSQSTTAEASVRASDLDAASLPLLIDTDIHEVMLSKRTLAPYLPDRWRKLLETHSYDLRPQDPGGNWKIFPPLVESRPEWKTGEERNGPSGSSLASMQRHLFEDEGVTHGILDGNFYPDAFPDHHEFAAAMGSAYNDWQIAEWLDKEPRLYGSVHISTDDVAGAVREIDRVAEHPQVVQVVLPLTKRSHYGSPNYRPVFAAAARHGLTVTLHQSAEQATALGEARTTFETRTIGGPQLAQSTLMAILASGVLDEFPELKVVVLEAGLVWVPWIMLRADEAYEKFATELPHIKRRPSECFRSNVRFSTQPLSDIGYRDLMKLIELVQADDMFLFSTDYPHYDADTFDTVLPPSMPAELRHKIAYGNALATYPRLAHLNASQGT